MTVRPEAVPEDLAAAYQFAFLVPLSVRLFGLIAPVGKELIHLPEGRLDIADTATEAEIVPVTSPGKASVRLFPPDEHREATPVTAGAAPSPANAAHDA